MTAKLGFRKWLELESIKKSLVEATETGDLPDKIFAFLSVAFGSVDEKQPWENSVFSVIEAMKLRPEANIPFLKDAPREHGKPADWDYEGREWAYWSHLIAKTYGWTLEYIGELDVNDALARVQEILTDEQLEREFYYGLSEIAYPYNKSTKKNHFKPMTRPYWMKPVAAPIQKTMMRKDMLPMGLVNDVSGMPQEYNPLRDVQKKTEETNAPPNS